MPRNPKKISGHFVQTGSGITCGTALIHFIQLMPPGSPKNILMYGTPAIAYGLGYLFDGARLYLLNAYHQWQLKSVVSKASESISNALNNPHLSGEYKTEVRKDLEQLYRENINLHLDRFRHAKTNATSFDNTSKSFDVSDSQNRLNSKKPVKNLNG